jgi:protein-tyrosine phosphatase
LQPRPRDLTWDGCVNVRDLGGHPTEDGGETRFGAVVRADSIRQLSDAGWAALVEYGIRTVVDLRFHSELEADPPRELPVEVVHISLLGEPEPARWDAPSGDEASLVRTVYLDSLERFRHNFVAAIEAVAGADDGGVCIHCAGGKDRTGLVTALLLRLAGVGHDAIAADYAVSGRNLAPLIEEWLADADSDEERLRRARLSAVPAEVMFEVLPELERRYGSVRGYLLAGGAAEEDLERVQARLRA